MIRKQQQQHYPIEEMLSETDGSQEIRQNNYLKQQWLKQIQQL